MQTTEWPGKTEDFRGKRASALFLGRRLTDAESMALLSVDPLDLNNILEEVPEMKVHDEWFEIHPNDYILLSTIFSTDVKSNDD